MSVGAELSEEKNQLLSEYFTNKKQDLGFLVTAKNGVYFFKTDFSFQLGFAPKANKHVLKTGLMCAMKSH